MQAGSRRLGEKERSGLVKVGGATWWGAARYGTLQPGYWGRRPRPALYSPGRRERSGLASAGRVTWQTAVRAGANRAWGRARCAGLGRDGTGERGDS